MKAVEVEFARNPFEVTEKVTRVVRKSSSGGSSGSSVPVASDGVPRADVSALVTEKLIADMGDANWKKPRRRGGVCRGHPRGRRVPHRAQHR